jgi:hypothetical protein
LTRTEKDRLKRGPGIPLLVSTAYQAWQPLLLDVQLLLHPLLHQLLLLQEWNRVLLPRNCCCCWCWLPPYMQHAAQQSHTLSLYPTVSM